MGKLEQADGAKPKDTFVSPQELAKAGLPENVRMTPKEMQAHLEMKERQEGVKGSAHKDAIASLRSDMSKLTPEQIERAEEAGRKREEMGR